MDDQHRQNGVNVKVQLAPEVDGMRTLPEAVLNEVGEQVKEEFWLSLMERVREEWPGATVYAAGRSGGWAVPHHPGKEFHARAFDRFRELCETELRHTLDTRWPEAVREALRVDALRCQNCGKSHGPVSACVVAVLSSVVQDRGAVDVTPELIAAVDTDALWNVLGPVVDRLEAQLADARDALATAVVDG